MSTISAMTNNTYMMYKMAQNNGLSLFSSSSSDSTSSLSSLYNKVTQSKDSTSDSSSSTSSSTSSSSLTGSSLATRLANASSQAQSDLNTINTIKTNIEGLTSSYTTTRKTFYAEFDSTMSDLKSAATTVKGMNYVFSSSDITTNADGTKTYSSDLQAAIKNVKNLVSTYNDALSFTSDNASVSDRMKALNTTFADTTYRASQYGAIGITVDSKTGALTLDEDKLAQALVDNGDRVQNTLGSNGLAGKATSHAQLATSQRSKLFPSMQSMIGGEMEVASLYTGKTLIGMTQYASIGNLLDFMF